MREPGVRPKAIRLCRTRLDLVDVEMSGGDDGLLKRASRSRSFREIQHTVQVPIRRRLNLVAIIPENISVGFDLV